MGLGLSWEFILFFAVVLILLYIFGWYLLFPLKFLLKLLVNAVIGLVALILLNVFGVDIGMNVINAFVIGVFGLPGLLVLLIIKLII